MVITPPSLLLSSLHRWPDHRMRSPHCNLGQGKDYSGDQVEMNLECLLLTSFARDIVIFSVTKNCCPICAQKGRANSKLKIFFNFKKKRVFFSRDRCESFTTNNKPESMESRMIDAPTGFHGKEPKVSLHKFRSEFIQIGNVRIS